MKTPSSDEEFWSKVDVPVVLRETKEKFRLTDFFEVCCLEPINIAPPSKIARLMNNVRMAKEEELKIQKILVRKKTIQEVQVNADEIRRRYEDQVSVIIKENEMLKDNCINLRKKLFQKAQFCRDQEFLITSYRVSQNFHYIEAKAPEEKPEEVKSLKSQLKLMKEVCNIYIQKLDEAHEKIRNLNEELEKTLKNHADELEKLQAEKTEMEKSLNQKLKDQGEAFKKYKEDVKSEIDVHTIINKKQNNTIFLLKDEIKRAQIVLQSPRLKQRTRNKLQSLTAENSVLMDRLKNKSFIPLRRSSQEQEVFNNTLIPLSNKSSHILAAQTSRKLM